MNDFPTTVFKFPVLLSFLSLYSSFSVLCFPINFRITYFHFIFYSLEMEFNFSLEQASKFKDFYKFAIVNKKYFQHGKLGHYGYQFKYFTIVRKRKLIKYTFHDRTRLSLKYYSKNSIFYILYT